MKMPSRSDYRISMPTGLHRGTVRSEPTILTTGNIISCARMLMRAAYRLYPTISATFVVIIYIRVNLDWDSAAMDEPKNGPKYIQQINEARPYRVTSAAPMVPPGDTKCPFPAPQKGNELFCHCSDVIMGAMGSQITSLTIVYSTVYSCADQRKHQISASPAFVWRIHRWPVIPRAKGR